MSEEKQDEVKFSSDEFKNSAEVQGAYNDGKKLYVYIIGYGIKEILKVQMPSGIAGQVTIIETDLTHDNGTAVLSRVRCNKIVSDVKVLNAFYSDEETFTSEEKKSVVDGGGEVKETVEKTEYFFKIILPIKSMIRDRVHKMFTITDANNVEHSFNYEDLNEEIDGVPSINLVLPIKKITKDSENYLLVITDANNVEHYFDNDFNYDGSGHPVKEDVKE